MSVAKAESRSFTVNGEKITYTLERKTIKRLNLRVKRDGEIHVSAPTRMPLATIESFLREKAAWIRAAHSRVMARRGETPTLEPGDVIVLEGVPHGVILHVGNRPGVRREAGVLHITVTEPQNAAERMQAFRRFVKTEAKRVLTARAMDIYREFAPHPATFPTLSFRWMSSRWGSCTASKNHITLNEKLLFVEPRLADYVIYHEFCHFKYQDHSAAFYRHLASFLPDHAAARAQLRSTPIPVLEGEGC
ncbi:MAG: M48 family metallopeptidase [Clostridia bacterium]|nr:M48 family metallopeptidase [Clostridia bacterium]